MHSRSDNIEIIVNSKRDEVIEELSESLLSRYQIGSETSIKGSEFVFDFVHLLYCKCYKSPNWIKNKKATVNPINKKDNKCFQYTITLELNHEKLKSILKELQRLNRLYLT